MLHAYFDDSGTHPGSEIVLMAGIFGYPNQLDFLSELWSKKLADPSPGKLALKRFHMAECQASENEFAGWNRAATDFLVHELGDIIPKAGVWGYAAAIDRKSYDQLMTGNIRRVCGDGETFCSIRCFQQVRAWAHEFTSESSIALVFDERPHKKADIVKIYDTYKEGRGADDPALPDIVSLSFASSSKMIPLQAADLVAWEFYQDAIDTLRGRSIEAGYRRKQMERLVKGGRLKSEMLDREGIIRLMETELDPQMLEEMAQRVGFA
jgi:hypothetical protein